MFFLNGDMRGIYPFCMFALIFGMINAFALDNPYRSSNPKYRGTGTQIIISPIEHGLLKIEAKSRFAGSEKDMSGPSFMGSL